MKVKDEWTTVKRIIKRRASISRYGDGEFKLCVNKHQICQKFNPVIRAALRDILLSEVPGLLVGIPRIYEGDLGWMPEKKLLHWKKFQREKIKKLLKPGKWYYSAFISRPDSVPEIDCPKYWDLCKEIWKDRYVVLLQGYERGFAKSDLFDGSDRLEILSGPRRNAFDQRREITSRLLQYPEEALLILSLGPAATVLASDLCKLGRQILDLGHLGMFYSRAHPDSKYYTGEYYDTDK